MSLVFAIGNQKGGVGKTTTCISLGACLAEAGHSTLVVDLDAQSNLTMSAGLDPDHLEWTIPDLLDPERLVQISHLSEAIKHTSVQGLDILPSDVRLASTERMLYGIADYESALGHLLSNWYSQYEYMLIDCPPSLGALTLTALTAAQVVIVPVQCEYYSARGLMRLVDVIDAVRRHTNPSLEYRLVTTMFDGRNKISQRVYDQLRENFGPHFFDTVVRVDTKLRESSVIGEPIVVYAPRSRSSEAYRKLAQEVITSIQTKGK